MPSIERDAKGRFLKGQISWKRNGKHVKCGYCGREIYRKGAWLRRSKHFFCSKKCHSSYDKGKSFTNNGSFLKGCASWNKGIPMSEETKIKLRKEHLSVKGDKHPLWKGGISNQPYPFNFNKELKLLIRKRDNYACQFPDCGKRENGRAHDVHHVDYDKDNLNPKNLITLCVSHNCKVNSNREYWKNYFQRRN